jgi:hypothetical protein
MVVLLLQVGAFVLETLNYTRSFSVILCRGGYGLALVKGERRREMQNPSSYLAAHNQQNVVESFK